MTIEERGAAVAASVEQILREGDAVERVLGVVAIVDRHFAPAQACIVARHRGEDVGADRLVGIADRDRYLDRGIEHLAAAVRRRLVGVAPHVEFLRRAADVDRDRLEREFGFGRGLGCIGLLIPAALSASLAAAAASSFSLAPLLSLSIWVSRVREFGGGLLLEVLGPRFGLIGFGVGERLVGEAISALARVLACSSLRIASEKRSGLACRGAEAFFASSAALAASAASRVASRRAPGAAATASAFGWNSIWSEKSTGSASIGEMITRIPIRVLSNSFSAKSYGIRTQPCEAA